MNLIQIIVTILVGALTGWIASQLMKSKGGFWRNVIIGIVGGFVGGFLAGIIGIGGAGGWIVSMLIAVGGSCLVIWVVDKFFK